MTYNLVRRVLIGFLAIALVLMASQMPEVYAQNPGVQVVGFAAWPPWETLGHPVKIMIWLENTYPYGVGAEVEFYYRKTGAPPDGTHIMTLTIDLLPNGTGFDTFTWNTTGVTYGVFEIRAKVYVGGNLEDEVDMSTMNGQRVYLTMPGDIGGDPPNWWGPYLLPTPDFTDNIIDVVLFQWFYRPIFGGTATWPWNPEADLDFDGDVDSADYIEFCGYFPSARTDLDHDGTGTYSDVAMFLMAYETMGPFSKPWNWIVDQDSDNDVDPDDVSAIIWNFGFSVAADPPEETPTSPSPQTTVYVDPPTTSAKVGTTFSIHIMASNVSNLCAWQAGMTFNPKVLRAVSFEKEPFLDTAGETKWIDARINNTSGEIGFCGHYLTSNSTSASGNGTLATVTFNVIGTGTSKLNITDVILIDPNIHTMPAEIVHGVHTSQPVGGVWVPVDKFGLLAPYIGLASTILVATAATAIYVKRVKRRKKKQ